MGGGAQAGATKVDVSGDHVVCNTVYGTIGISPALVAGGTTPTKITLKGTIDGCVDTDNAAIHIAASKFSGKLGGQNNDLTGLAGAAQVTGTIVIKWKTQKDTALLQTSTTITPNSTCGGLVPISELPGAPSHASFHIGGPSACPLGGTTAAPSATGAFVGGADAGASSTTDALSSQDLAPLLGATSIKAINIGVGVITVG